MRKRTGMARKRECMKKGRNRYRKKGKEWKGKKMEEKLKVKTVKE